MTCDRRGFVIALSVEKSGRAEFDFEYGADFADHIETFDPSFAKVLVDYNPQGEGALNQRQCKRPKQLSDYCRHCERIVEVARRDGRNAVEAASRLGWERHVGRRGTIIATHSYGLSAPGKAVEAHFGFDAAHLVTAPKALLAQRAPSA